MITSFCDGRIFGSRFGEGPVRVVALPGWCRDHVDFRTVGDGLSCGMVAVDLPGFGASPPPNEPWTTAQYSALIADLIGEIGGPVVVVGHSFGGRIAVRLAASSPGLVRALVLTGVPLIRPVGARAMACPPMAYRLIRRLHRWSMVSDARMEAARQKHGSADYRAASGVMRDVLVKAVNEDYDSAIATIGCPVELVWSDDDAEVPLDVARAIETAIPGSRLTVCPGAGHLLPLTAPDRLREAIVRVAP